MPQKLVDTLLKKCENMAKKLAGEGKPQLIPVFQFVHNIMENNNLIPAWDEIPQIKKILQSTDELKLFEKAGKLKLKLKKNDFFLEFEIVVPTQYPAKKPELTILTHNYDKNFTKIYEATVK